MCKSNKILYLCVFLDLHSLKKKKELHFIGYILYIGVHLPFLTHRSNVMTYFILTSSVMRMKVEVKFMLLVCDIGLLNGHFQ